MMSNFSKDQGSSTYINVNMSARDSLACDYSHNIIMSLPSTYTGLPSYSRLCRHLAEDLKRMPPSPSQTGSGCHDCQLP